MHVRISVNGATLGDVDVEAERLHIFNDTDLRAIINELLADATGKIRRAYELESPDA